MPTMTDLIRAAARRTEIAPSTDAIRAAADGGVVSEGPTRDDAGRFAAANTPMEALCAVRGARKPALVAKLIQDGADPGEQLAAIRGEHPELFFGPGSADGGARGAASQAPAPFDPFRAYREGLL
jgi:hypothetical protein